MSKNNIIIGAPSGCGKVRFSNVFRVMALSAMTYAGATSAFAQNVLVNGDFELNPPSTNGNNIGWSILPWVLGTGNKANVVQVDGPGGYNYGTNGPESDASAPGNKPQHYLDITNGQNDFYQSFKPRCSGQVRFGGFFSTRANSYGSASVKIVNGVGPLNAVVGATQMISLVGGNSKTDPWTPASYTVPVTANATYSFVVTMDNNMNFDNGFVEYIENCPEEPTSTVEPCCPPWNADTLLHQLKLTQSGNVLGNIAYSFVNSAPYKNQMQAYIDYLHSINPSIKNIVLYWAIEDHGPAGPGTSPTPAGTQIGPAEFTEWSCGATSTNSIPCQGYSTSGGGGALTNGNGSNVFNPSQHPLPPNRWYRIYTYIYLNDGIKFWSEKCSGTAVDLAVYAGAAAGQRLDPSRIAVEYRQPGASTGQIITIPLNRSN